MRKGLLAALFILALVASACGGDHEGHDMSGGGAGNDDEMSMEGTVPGEAAAPSDADRTVTIKAEDKLAFEPSSLDVSVGEVVTFVVVNDGKAPHEFVLGDQAYQESHEDEMSGGGHSMMDSDSSVSVDPGEKAKVTWRFTEAGEVLFGCHEPGHYAGGMVGTITVG